MELYQACEAGDVETVQKLLSQGANVNNEYHDKTPLYAAAKNGHVAVVEILVKAGADVNKGFGSTPLHAAARKGHFAVIVALLACNADQSIKNKKGKSALDIMLEKYKIGLTELFAKKPARSLSDMSMWTSKQLTPFELNLMVAEKRALIAEENSVALQQRATIAEERAAAAEEKALVCGRVATNAEERAVVAEKRAVSAEEGKASAENIVSMYEVRAIESEKRVALAEASVTTIRRHTVAVEHEPAAQQRNVIVEEECAILNQQLSYARKHIIASEERARVAEQRARIAEEWANAVNKSADAANKRARVSEERAAVAEKSTSVAEERAKASESEVTAMKEKLAHAIAEVMECKDQIKATENIIKVLQEGVQKFENRIILLMEENEALEQRANTAKQQVQEQTAQLALLRQQQEKVGTPSWVVKKENIVLGDKELGRGGWGVVRVATYCGQDVAVKFLHGETLSPYYMELFKREMNMSALVRHPNILLFIGAVMDQECIIVTELMQTSLRAVLETKMMSKSTLSHQQIFSISMDVARALNYLHLMTPDAIIHRDVSSSNVLLEPLGEESWKAKLSDFGSSNFARQVRTVGPGNASYAAPESSDPLLQSPKMDVFSLGILFLEMTCGQFPDVAKRQDLIKSLPWPKMKTIVKRCIARNPKNRPNMADVLKEIPRE